MNLLKTTDEWALKCQELTRSNDKLANQAAILLQANGHLRKANKVRPHVKLYLKAEASAKILALWHVGGYRTGKNSCVSYGMSENTYFYGRALLMLAALHDGHKWLIDDPDEIERRIEMTVAYAEAKPEILAMSIPNSRRPKEYRSIVNDYPFGRSSA